MAKYNLENYIDANGLGFPLNFRRGNPNPLDNSAVWPSLAAAQNYAATDPVAYVGQILTVVETVVVDAEAGTTTTKVTAYTIQDESGTLLEVGASLIGDGTQIEVIDGQIRLVGAADAEVGAQPRINSDGEIEWVVPSTSTVDGLQSSVAGLQSDVSGLRSDVSDLQSDVSGLQTGVDGILTTLESTAQKDYVAQAIAGADHLVRKIVTSIDEVVLTAEDAAKYIYMVKTAESGDDRYDEYMVVDGALERVGDWGVNLDGYATTSDLEGKVDKADGERLMTDAEGEKLAGVAEGAEVNVIASVDETQFAIDEDRNLTLLEIAMSKVTGLDGALAAKVDAVEGKGLSTNDFTDEHVAKLEGISAGAEVNIIEAVKVNGVLLEIDEDKSVNIPVGGESLGVVKSSDAQDGVSVAEDGTMTVNSISVSKLVQAEDEVLILNGGAAV